MFFITDSEWLEWTVSPRATLDDKARDAQPYDSTGGLKHQPTLTTPAQNQIAANQYPCQCTSDSGAKALAVTHNKMISDRKHYH